MPGVIITEDGDILSISYGPHDQAYDNPHFVAIPSEESSTQSDFNWRHWLAGLFVDPKTGVSLPLPLRPGHPFFSRGSGGPSMAAPTSTEPSKRSESGRTSSAKGYSAHGFSSGKAPTARGKCPKGHYWSYKKKKCVKSKFR